METSSSSNKESFLSWTSTDTDSQRFDSEYDISDKVCHLIQGVKYNDPDEWASANDTTGSIPTSIPSLSTSDDDDIDMVIGQDTSINNESGSYTTDSTSSDGDPDDEMSVDLSQAKDAMSIDLSQSSDAAFFYSYNVPSFDISDDNDDPQPKYLEYLQLKVFSDYDVDDKLDITSVDPKQQIWYHR